jgi:adenylate kinase family enzyme
LGPAGAGKATFARRLGKRLALSVVHFVRDLGMINEWLKKYPIG